MGRTWELRLTLLGEVPHLNPTMNFRDVLISEIESYVRETGLSEASLGSFAVKDSRFVARVRNGKGVSLSNIEKLQAYMRERGSRKIWGRKHPMVPASAPAPAP